MQEQKLTYQSYPDYKESGISWLGRIPSHWDRIPFKNLFNEKDTRVNDESDKYTLLSLTLKGVIKRDMENPQGKFPASFDTYKVIERNDFIFCLFDVEETPRTIGISPYEGMITGAYTLYNPSTSITSKRYIEYLFLDLDNAKALRFLYKGLRNTIPKDSLGSLKIPIPPLPEQNAIADFLDKKTEAIDKSIAQKEKLIELLKERKRIIIQEAVTKGIDPDVPMKDSGIEWIGEIPEYWEVLPGFLIFHESKILNTGLINTNLLSLSYGEIIQKNIDTATGLVPLSYETYQIVEVGNIIFRPTDLQNDKVSLRNAISHYEGIITSAYLNFKSHKSISSIFLNHIFRVIDNNKVIYGLGSGLRQNISFDDFKRFLFPVPPINEQKEINNYIENKTKQIDKIIEKEQELIEKLKEYKIILINDAVTGKIKVPTG